MHQPPGARILVVDDNPDNRDMLARRVRRIGPHRIDMAEDGLDALAQIGAALEAGDGHDVVMLDVMMPRMNGVEVLVDQLLDDRHPVIGRLAGLA